LPKAAQSAIEGRAVKQFEGLIQNQQYLPNAKFKLLPYFARTERRTKAA
jgi:hypothetical protein